MGNLHEQKQGGEADLSVSAERNTVEKGARRGHQRQWHTQNKA